MDNDSRAERARVALDEYNEAKGEDEPLEDVLGDLLTDMMHLCKREEIDFWEKLQTAQMHFNEERNGN